MSDERFVVTREPMGLEHAWRRLTTGPAYSPKVWTDRYLAAFALTGNMVLATLDKAFKSIQELPVLILEE